MYSSNQFTSSNSQSQKPSCYFCLGGQSPCARCSGTPYSSSQSREGSTNKPLASYTPQQLSEVESQKIQSFPILGMYRQTRPTTTGLNNKDSKFCSLCQEKEAPRLCLNCKKELCDGCALDKHKSHDIVRIIEIPEMMKNKKAHLKGNLGNLESYLWGKEQVFQALKVKEEELMRQADSVLQNYYDILQSQREAAKNGIQKGLKKISEDYFRKTQNNNPSKNHALEWISNFKKLSQDIENSQITDNISILCSLYKQEESYKKLDITNLKRHSDKIALENSFNKIQIQCNNQLLERLKKETAIEIISNQSDNHYQTPSYLAAARQSISGSQILLNFCINIFKRCFATRSVSES